MGKAAKRKVAKWTKEKAPAATKKKRKAIKVPVKRKRQSSSPMEEEQGEDVEEEEEEEEEEVKEKGKKVRGHKREYEAHNISMSVEGTADKNQPFFTRFDPDSYTDSREAARDLLRMIISPLTIEKFNR